MFYKLSNGLGMRQYCLDNNIPYSTIYWKIRQGLTVDDAIKSYNPNIGKAGGAKYFKNGLTLRQYCVKNNLKYYKEREEYIHENNRT